MTIDNCIWAVTRARVPGSPFKYNPVQRLIVDMHRQAGTVQSIAHQRVYGMLSIGCAIVHAPVQYRRLLSCPCLVFVTASLTRLQ